MKEYMTQNITIGKHTKYPLKGILTLPSHTAEPMPAVVLVHGSGPSNRDEKVGRLTPFKDLAEGLAEHGIASTRYDKRTYAHGLKLWMDRSKCITVREETIEDAILATELLRNDSRIDGTKIFILGHSMGGMLAPRIDAEGGRYRGLILMAGSPRRLEEIMREQVEESLQQMRGLTKKLVKKSMGRILNRLEGMYEQSEEEARKIKIGGGMTLYYFKEMGERPVSQYLEKMDKPMLILQGEKDFQVKKDIDFAAYQELLQDRKNVTFRLYANLNHAFVESVYGSILKAGKEYRVKQHIRETVIRDIAEWILSVSMAEESR